MRQLKIGHVAPFAPNRAGLFEAAADMAHADALSGHNVYFVDAGITVNGERQPPVVGGTVERGNFKLETCEPKYLDDCDIILMHTGAPDSWLVRNQIPLIWVVHGRPRACFIPEINNNVSSYSLYSHVSSWKRSKKMLYFWKEFKPHWEFLFNGKDLILEYPPISEKRFNTDNIVHPLQNKGDINFLICDSVREDIDIYESVIGFIEAAKTHKNIKLHFYGFDYDINNLPNAWKLLINRLKELNVLGDVVPRVDNMELVYRACDCLISPNRIITRTIGESLMCGTPVIAQNPCSVADYTADFAQPDDIKQAIELFINDKMINSDTVDRNMIAKHAYKRFNLNRYSEAMNYVYNEILEGD